MEGFKFTRENMSALIGSSMNRSRPDEVPAHAATAYFDVEKAEVVQTPGFVCLHLIEDPDQEIARKFVESLGKQRGVEAPHYNPEKLNLEYLLKPEPF